MSASSPFFGSASACFLGGGIGVEGVCLGISIVKGVGGSTRSTKGGRGVEVPESSMTGGELPLLKSFSCTFLIAPLAMKVKNNAQMRCPG